MDRMSEIEYRIAEYDHEFLVFADEGPGQRTVGGLHNDAISDPLPELRLRCPELLAVPANNASSFLLPFFLL